MSLIPLIQRHPIGPDQNVLDLIAYLADQAEPLWPGIHASIPDWHPRNEETPEEKVAREAREAAEKAKNEKDKEKDDVDKDDDDDVVKVPRSEHEALRKEVAERRRREQKAEKDKKDAEKRSKAEQGQFKELAEEAQKDRDEAIKERDEARAELTKFKSRGLISKVAKRLNFEDPDDARVWFSEYAREGEDQTKESDVEAVCKRILKDKPKLQSKAPKTGGPGNGNGLSGGLTFEDIQGMSQDEISTRFNEPAFQAALKAGPTR